MGALNEYAELRSRYKEAEDLLHSLGVDTSIDVAAINELRYAGRHALDAMLATRDDERQKQIDRATAHCERAIYDAYDAAIFFKLRTFDQFVDDYKLVQITDVIPDYLDLVEDISTAKNMLQQARSEEDSRADYYAQAREHHDRMTHVLNRLTAARPELNKLVQAYNTDVERTIAAERAAEEAKVSAAQAQADASRGRRQTLWVAIATVAVNSAFWLARIWFDQ